MKSVAGSTQLDLPETSGRQDLSVSGLSGEMTVPSTFIPVKQGNPMVVCSQNKNNIFCFKYCIGCLYQHCLLHCSVIYNDSTMLNNNSNLYCFDPKREILLENTVSYI